MRRRGGSRPVTPPRARRQLCGSLNRQRQERQGDGDCGPGPEFALDLERSAMQLDNRFSKRQTQTSPLMLGIEDRVDAVERLLNEGDVLRADPDPGVPNTHTQHAGTGLTRYRHATARGREFYCIADQEI